MEARIRPGSADGSEVIAEIEHQYGSEQIYFRSRDVALDATPDALIPLALIPAMYLGEPLKICGQISPSLEANLKDLQMILNGFDPALGLIQVTVDSGRERPAAAQGGAGCFYSGGVDSSYTLLRRTKEIDAAIFIRGFDVPVERSDIFDAVVPRLKAAAAELGVSLVEVETNLKSFSNRFVNWPYHYYGAALATVAHLLGTSFGRIHMAGGYSYELIPANGAHPLLDPVWGSDAVSLVYDGGEATRSSKVRLISTSEMLLRSLRVCTEFLSYNCGRCGKCLLTMAALRGAGALERCSFAAPLDLDSLSRFDASDFLYAFRLREVLQGVATAGNDRDLEVALASALLRSSYIDYLERASNYRRLPLRLIRLYAGRQERTAGGVAIETPPEVWAYAATMNLPFLRWRSLLPWWRRDIAFVRLRLSVRGASIGVGVTTADGKDFVVRTEVRPSEAAQQVLLRIPEPRNAGSLVIQTWNLPVAAHVCVQSVELAFGNTRLIDSLPR
jgi:hypothetical protein